jgi:hypothetical protein
MPRYAWVCHSCHATNPAASEACSSCGFPAVASLADIEEAKAGVKRPPRLSRKEWEAIRRAEIAALPFWKKPLAYALQALRVIGAVFLLSAIFDLSLRTALIGLAIVLVAEVLFSLLKGPPYVWKEN